MSTHNHTIGLPQGWTAEQAEFLSAILEDLSQAIWDTYEDALIRLWRDRDGLILPCKNQLDLQLHQPAISPMDPEPLGNSDDDIPW